MFGKLRFPLPTNEKVDIEYHLDWLLRRFGLQPIRKFPNLTLRSPELSPYLSRHGADRQGLLQFIEDRFPFDASGCELIDWDGEAEVPPDRDIILLNPEEQSNAEALINRLAGHLCWRFLGTLNASELETTNYGMLSEFLAVYFGWGVFGANMALMTSMYTDGGFHEWRHQKFTHTAARHFGVALAYRAWLRNDPDDIKLPRMLRPDAKVPYQKALKYLQQTGDSLFDPSQSSSVFVVDELSPLEPLLENASPGLTVAVLQRVMDLAEPGSLEDDDSARFLYLRLPGLLQHKDDSIRLLACLAADRFGSVNAETLDRLKDLLNDRVADVRREATSCIVYLAPPGQILARDLKVSLKDSDTGTVEAAVKGLVFLQQEEEEVVPNLLRLIRRSLVHGEGVDTNFLFAALDTVCNNAEERVRDYLQSDEQEVVNAALNLIRNWREHSQDAEAGEVQT